MSKLTKYGKKLLFSFVTLLLLVSFNLNTFAATSNSIHFGDYSFSAYYYPNNVMTDCTSKVSLGNSTQSINGVSTACTGYLFSGTSSYDKLLNTGADLGLYTNTQYKFSFYTKVGMRAGYKYSLFVYLVVSNENEEGSMITLYDGNDLATNTWNKVEGNFKTPDISGNVSAALVIMLRTLEADSTSQQMILSDMSLTLDSPLYGESINTPTVDEFDDAMNDYEITMEELPSIDKNQLDSLMNFDFDNFTSGMQFVRNIFDRTMSVFGFSAVLTFALTIGLATYIIGRKVG